MIAATLRGRAAAGDEAPTSGVAMVGWLSNAAKAAALLDVDPATGDDIVLERAYRDRGIEGFAICDGSYVAAVRRGDKVVLAASGAPGPPLYWGWEPDQRTLWFGTRCVDFPLSLLGLRDFEEITEEQLRRRPALTPFEGINRVVAGTAVEVDLRLGRAVPRVHWDWQSGSSAPGEPSELASREALKSSLTTAISGTGRDPAYCLVSGDLDSSIVATLLTREREEVELISLGTERANEFESARRVGERLGKPVREILVSEDGYEEHFPRLVLALEHPFSTYAEYLLPLWVALREGALDLGRDIFTGYGSDVLFAGFAPADAGAAEVEWLVRSEYESAFYSNEFSQAISPDAATRVISPFFDSGVVRTALSIEPGLKHDGTSEKAILRRAFEADLGPELAWRPKLGVHTSTRSEGWLTGYACPAGDNGRAAREVKDRLSYEILRRAFVDGEEPEEIKLEEVVGACR